MSDEVVKTNYQHRMEIDVPKTLDELEQERTAEIQRLETALEKARLRLSEWEAKGHDTVPEDPVESRILELSIQQESTFADFYHIRRDWKLKINRLKDDIESSVWQVRSNQEGRAKGYLGMKVKDYDLRFVDAAPTMLAQVGEMEKKLMAVHESEEWRKGEAELKAINERIYDIVSGNANRREKEEQKALAAEEAKKFPWSTPGEASAYVYVGNELWNTDTLTKERSPIYNGGNIDGPACLIRNQPGLVAFDAFGENKNTTGFLDLANADAEEYRTGQCGGSIRESIGISGIQQLRVSDADRRRFVFIAEGDLWRGTVDWRDRKAVDVKRLTNTSQLGGARILHWHGRTVWLWTGLSQKRPVARIDLITGAIAETPSYNLFPEHENHLIASPSGEIIVSLTQERILALDLKNNRLIALANHFSVPVANPSANQARQERYEQGKARIYTLEALDGRAVWLPGEKLLAYNDWGRPVVLDLRAGSGTILPAPPQLPPAADIRNSNVKLESHVAGTPYLLIGRTWSEDTPGGGRTVRKSDTLLLDASTGQYRPAPSGAQDFRQVNERLVFYEIRDGGLNGSGTWIWDIASGETARLTPLFFTGVYANRDWVFLPQRNRLLAHASGGEGARDSLRKLLVFDFKSGVSADTRELPVDFSSSTFKGGHLSGIAVQELELGFSPDAPDPWETSAKLPMLGDPALPAG
ncbi:MAG TPA: hypothetical protein PLA50_04085 [Bacteroidia bacterium]|nr:hypothetical protein [Bacteroidia bacterium]